MSKNNIEDCNTSSGKLKYVISEVKKPINRQYLIDKLAVFFKNTQKAKKSHLSFLKTVKPNKKLIYGARLLKE